jgi:hypothetical protein
VEFLMDESIPEPWPYSPYELQALHRRLLAAKEAGVEPDPADVAMRDQAMASPYANFDRAWARDEW